MVFNIVRANYSYVKVMFKHQLLMLLGRENSGADDPTSA